MFIGREGNKVYTRDARGENSQAVQRDPKMDIKILYWPMRSIESSQFRNKK